METITLKAHVGADGILTLQAPITVTNSGVEVVIVVQPVKPKAERAAGGWQGEKLVSKQSGEYEVRKETAPLAELVKELLALTPGEKAQALRVLALDLAAWPGIEKTPGVVGGEARIVRTRIPVWVLDGYRRASCSEAQLLENYPTLHAADLVNAWAYADAHAEEIERARRENTAQ
jgi:uncharacterized protein (DUF433 family)